ncbi:MAG: TonB-dependent receptor [Myxococcota bacterium]|jgi:outer membrane receptor protein involved in Fe transport|nr:TonB-dependent receptor [Myxococcota bacterium]
MLRRALIFVLGLVSGWLPSSAAAEGTEDAQPPAPTETAEEDWFEGELDNSIYEARVVEQRPVLSAGASNISAAEIARSLPTSGSDALRLVPGLRIVQHSAEGKGHQLFLRGFDAVHGSDVEVLLGDVPLNERLNVHGNGYLDLYGIIPEVVSELRVHKGPFLPWQGAYATAGSAVFELGVGPQLRPGLMRTEVSQRGRLRAVVLAAPSGLPDEVFLASEAVYDAGFAADREAKRGALLASYRSPSFAGFELSTLLSAQAAAWESPGVLRFDGISEHGFYGTYDTGGGGSSERLLARIGLAREHEGTRLDLSVHGALRRFELEDNYTGFLLYEDQGDAKRQLEHARMLGASTALEQRIKRLSSALFAKLGWQLDAGDEREAQVGTSGAAWQTNRRLGARIHSLFAYAGLRMSPWRWLAMLASLRGDLFIYSAENHVLDRKAQKNLGALSPRVALSFPVHRALTLFVDYGRGFRPPEARSITAFRPGTVEDEELSQYRGGQPTVNVADAIEAGLRATPAPWLSLGTTFFATWMDREVAFDHVSNTNLELFGSRRTGAEMDLRVAPTPWLAFGADATFVDARFEHSAHRIPGTSSWLGRATATLGRDRGPHGEAELTFVTTRYLAHGASASGYALLDLCAGWRLEHFDASVLVDNALDAKVMDGVYHYASRFDLNGPRSAIPVIHYTAAAPVTARFVFTAFF